MKILFLIFSGILLTTFSFAQLKVTAVCPPFTLDVLDGHISKVYPKSTQGEILKAFPCATEVLSEDSVACAGVFYKDKGVYFFTDRDYIEIRENFTGKSTLPLMGADRKSLFSKLGNPKLKDITWEAYQMQYGTLVIYYTAENKVNKIQFTSRSAETLKLCD